MKWCYHCRKGDHDDSECWSTRAVPAYVAPVFGLSTRALAPPGTSTALMEALRRAAVLPPQDISHDPPFTL